MATTAESWTLVGHCADVPVGEVRVVMIGETRVALCNLDGEFVAVHDLCTHDNGPLGQGCLEGDEIECPRHGARFSVRTGEATMMPAVMPIRTFPVKVDGDDVYIHVT